MKDLQAIENDLEELLETSQTVERYRAEETQRKESLKNYQTEIMVRGRDTFGVRYSRTQCASLVMERPSKLHGNGRMHPTSYNDFDSSTQKSRNLPSRNTRIFSDVIKNWSSSVLSAKPRCKSIKTS
jgi:hypothetical protein